MTHWVAMNGQRNPILPGPGFDGALSDLLAACAIVFALTLVIRQLTGLPEVAILHTGVAFVLIAVPLAIFRPRNSRLLDGLGAANRVTLLRAVATALLAGLLFHATALAVHGWWLLAAVTATLALDGIDGWVARRRGSSAFGARFDMELDAFFILVLSAWVLALDKAGAWVLLIGAMRYIFLAAGCLAPALRAPLPERFGRKAICVWQVVTLLACLAPVTGRGLAAPALALALALLVGSFARDSVWLFRRFPRSHTRSVPS